jgi:dihydroxy-acid dehydratase
VFDREESLIRAFQKGEVKPTENTVLVIRYEGPKGGPGMVSLRGVEHAVLKC